LSREAENVDCLSSGWAAFSDEGFGVSRVKHEKQFPGVRILFFSIPVRNCVFVTGIHSRGVLGVGQDYDFSKEPFTRAQRYWGFRENLCPQQR
jgi:hypothetical protein